ncbi:hypothetical protein [Georgenia sp. SUBG003]|uniref:hypothetical protein n=1 Tax=Georgenia sp. SUBG003 TaxID=1497974 RepID=UPI0004D5570E|nr:hypothetical protein DA06_17280 [Georgenia sp. SUBG003]
MYSRAVGRAARTAGVVLVVLAACTGPPGRDVAPPPPPDRPATTSTGSTAETSTPSQDELTKFLSEAGDFVPSTHPGLLVVTRDGFAEVRDDPTVERGRLVPPLPENHVWRCLTEDGPRTVVCLGLGDAARFEQAPGPRCGTVRLERHRVGRSLVTHRTYGPDGRLTQQITHEKYEEHYTLPGSDLRTGGGADAYVIDDLAPDGTTVRTRRVVGSESYQHTLDGELIWVDHGGAARRRPPTGTRR